VKSLLHHQERRPARASAATTAALALFLAGLSAAPAWAANPLVVKSAAAPTEWTITQGTNTLLVYAFAAGKFKPYVKALAPLGGVNLLRDAPHDHLHHHGLMYGIMVNGLDFWAETPGSGVQKPVASPPPEVSVGPDGQPRVTIRQTLHWLAPADAFLPDSPKVALLVEQRTLVLTVNEPDGEVALRWTSAFEVGGQTNTVTLTGREYLGLGMRFLEELDPLAEHRNTDGQPDLAGTKQDASQHSWAAVSFDRPGQPATIAVFGLPANAGGDAHFFSMKRPFAYLAATQGLDKEPLIYHTGDKFTVNYLVTVYPELRAKDFLDRRGKTWTESAP